MADTAQLLAEAAALLAERGVPVERYPGWRTCGKSRLRPQVHVEHDTADPEPLSRPRMLDLLANGHGSLRNALCTWAVPRERPAAVLIAARTAWHAGRGSWDGVSGNSRATGTEIQRAQGQTVTAEQWEIAAEITRVEIEVFGPLDVVRVCTHNEWTPRKTDPQGLSGAAWRNRLARTPDPEPDERWADIMIRIWHGRDTEDRSEPAWWLVVLSDLEYRLLGDPATIDTWTRRVESSGDPDVIGHSDAVDKARPAWFAGLDRVG